MCTCLEKTNCIVCSCLEHIKSKVINIIFAVYEGS